MIQKILETFIERYLKNNERKSTRPKYNNVAIKARIIPSV